MSDAPSREFFRAVRGSRKAGEPVACAFLLDPCEPVEVSTVRLSWSPLLAARLREIADAAAGSDVPEGRSLPFSSLRAALQVQVPDAVMLVWDLGRTWAREGSGAFMHVAADAAADPAARAAGALRTWSQLALRPWAARIGLDEGLVDAVDDAADPALAFSADAIRIDLAEALASGQPFDRMRHAALQEVSRRLEGLEMFPGLGPVRRIVRARSGGNEVQFETWPIAAKSGGLFSMVAGLKLMTVPFSGKPIMTVRASRRRWLDGVPAPEALRRQRSMSFHIMGRGGAPITLEGAAWVRDGVPEEPCSPEFMHQALSIRADLALPIAEMARMRGQDVFLGVPYTASRDGSFPVGAGASTRDQLDLLDAAAGPLAGMGLRTLPVREAAEPKRRQKREAEHHKALEVDGLVADVAIALGSNELGTDDLIVSARMLLTDAEPPALSQKAALKARDALEKVREANRARVRRIHGAERPTVVLLARLESERQLMRAAVQGLFGASVEIVERQLPRDVHGLRSELPAADGKAQVRFAARVEAWRELAMDLSASYGGCHALVQADQWYGRRREDAVNKMAGRQALATAGDANVQYLLPPEPGWRGIARYLHRVQAAVYDLMFGHAALVSEVGSLLQGAFPDEAMRPRAVLGLSVVTQARLRTGAKGGQVCLATRIDAATGRTTARVGAFEKLSMRWTGWLPFFEAMKHIATLESATLGPDDESRRRSYQKFVESTLDGAMDADDRPLVLIDATTASGLWPWLADSRIDGALTIGPEGEDKSARWESARLVRVRTGVAGRVLERKTARYERVDPGGAGQGTVDRYCPTVTERTVEVSASALGGRHYWMIGGYLDQTVRGLSVWRSLPHYLPLAKIPGAAAPDGIPADGLLAEVPFDISDDPYRLPNALDVTVATLSPGDDADLVADMVADLRAGYGHSRLDTALPAPLFFETKARDYMARFTLGEIDEEDGDASPSDPASGAAGPDLADADPDGDAVDPDDVPLSMPGIDAVLDGPDAVPDPKPDPDGDPDGGIPGGEGGGEDGGMEDGGDMTARKIDATADVANWVEASKGKLLPVPSFVTREWLQDKMSLQGNFRLVRDLHRLRAPIRADTGFAWPEKCPAGSEIVDVVLAGLAHANFVRTMTLAARYALGPRKGKDFHLFKTFSKRITWAYSSPSPRIGGKPVLHGPPTIARGLLAAGHRDAALAFIYLSTLGSARPLVFSELASEEDLHELDGFLAAAAAAALDDGFDWLRDVDGVGGEMAIGRLAAAATLAASASPASGSQPTETADGGSDCGDDQVDDPADEEALGEDGETGVPGGDDMTDAEGDGADGTPRDAFLPTDADATDGPGHETAMSADDLPLPVPEEADADQAAQSWRASMAGLSDAASAASDAVPDEATLQAVMVFVRSARTAARAWKAAQPKLEDAGPLLDLARAVLVAVAEMRPPNPVEYPEFPADGPALVAPEVARSASDMLGRAEAAVAEARMARGDAKTIMSDPDDALSRFAELTMLNKIATREMETAVARVTSATALLVGAVRAGIAAAQDTAPASLPADAPDRPSGERPLPAVPGDVPGLQDAPVLKDAPVPPEASAGAGAGAAPGPVALPDPADDPGFEFAETLDARDSERALEEDAPAEMAVTVEPEQEAPPSAPSPTVDRLVREVDARLLRLVTAGAFGSAFHLVRAASRVVPAMRPAFSADELRLAAMSGHIGHGAMQGSPLIDRVVSAAVAEVGAIAGDTDTDGARRIILAAVCVELAMFHPGVPAAIGIGAIADVSPDLSEAFHDLEAAVTEGARLTIITPALLRAVGDEAADDRYFENARGAVLDNLEAFSRLRFNWVPANKIRAAMHVKGGPLGDLRETLTGGGDAAVAAARSFAAHYRDRAAVIALVDRIDNGGAAKFKGMDGAARERMVSAFDDLTALCADYAAAAAAAAAPSARNGSQKALVQRIAQAVAEGASRASAALEAHAATASPVVAAAVRFASGAIGRLRQAAMGRPASAGLHDHMLAVHGSLLWLPGLHYGNSWLPAPYVPESVLDALLAAPVPPADMGRDDTLFAEAVRARVAEGAFVAAGMLVQGAAFYGVGDETRAAMAEHCAHELDTARDALKDRLEAARRLIDKVQRMGGLVRMERASALLASFERIDPDTLPSDVSLEARGEEEEPVQILDFCSAQEVVTDVEDRVRGLLGEPRSRLQGRLDALQGRARDADIEHVRRIIGDEDDLVTAAEYIGFMEDGSSLPEIAAVSRRFLEYFPAVPDALSRDPKLALDRAEESIKAGLDMPALPFSRLSAEAKAGAVEILDLWRNLRRRVDGGRSPQDVHTFLERWFTEARLSPEVITPVFRDQHLPKTYVAEFRLTIPEDTASLLLPDYGSLPKFAYRIFVVAKMPPEGELSIMCKNAGNYAVMVIVTSVVDVARRMQLALNCIEQKRTALVVDEAILLHALAEKEFRPLTMLECAQPFSYAAPYQDYGNSAVPPEMFFGREVEVRKITDRMGSCIVYGGRRLGKTALLRHVQALSTGPGTGDSMVVGYADIRDIGPTPSRLWDVASRALPAIFPGVPAKSHADFTSKVRAWLKSDDKRRVLLLLDEADGFIDGDAKQNFKEFGVLQGLMGEDSRRFKFVLAGLHNVTRIVRTENSPLKQIASDPLRIGPLVDAELREAERLVTRPMAALGFEFRSRSDVWRILSHCNYYPVLVQTFCAGLLGALNRGVKHRRPLWEITGKHVRDAIDNEDIRKEIEAKYSYTIRNIDPRYELIACVVAERALNENAKVNDGMTAVDVLDAVSAWWPPAFEHPNRLEIVKDLLDEMVGLGVLRLGPSGTWALRSHAILRLLDEETVSKRLLEFLDEPAPRAFDPRSMRRGLTFQGVPKHPNGYPCPLTMGQEHDIFAGEARISVVLGNTLSDISLVADALRTADPVMADGSATAVLVRLFPAASDVVDEVRKLSRATAPAMVVVDMRSPWNASWIEILARQKSFKDGRVRVVFVGGPDQARQWALEGRTASPNVRVVPLQTWADTYVEHELGRDNLPAEQFAGELRRVTGGFNRPMAQALVTPGGADRFKARLRAADSKTVKDRELLADLGFAPPMAEVFRRIAEWADDAGRIGAEEIREGAADALAAVGMGATQVIDFGLSMAVLSAQAMLPGDHADNRSYAVTPLLRTALAQQAAVS